MTTTATLKSYLCIINIEKQHFAVIVVVILFFVHFAVVLVLPTTPEMTSFAVVRANCTSYH